MHTNTIMSSDHEIILKCALQHHYPPLSTIKIYADDTYYTIGKHKIQKKDLKNKRFK